MAVVLRRRYSKSGFMTPLPVDMRPQRRYGRMSYASASDLQQSTPRFNPFGSSMPAGVVGGTFPLGGGGGLGLLGKGLKSYFASPWKFALKTLGLITVPPLAAGAVYGAVKTYNIKKRFRVGEALTTDPLSLIPGGINPLSTPSPYVGIPGVNMSPYTPVSGGSGSGSGGVVTESEGGAGGIPELSFFQGQGGAPAINVFAGGGGSDLGQLALMLGIPLAALAAYLGIKKFKKKKKSKKRRRHK